MMKKVELHCHFDGSFDPDYLSELAGRDVTSEVSGRGSTSLAEFLKRFDLPLALSQTPERLERLAELLAKSLAADGVIYAEVRFCPFLHTTEIGDVNVDQVIASVLKGLQSVPELQTGLIFCMTRELSSEKNRQIIDLAQNWRSKGVCGVDLAGNEVAHPNQEFLELFDYAKSLQLPLTIHAGEAASHRSVDAVISAYPHLRIGHGVRAIESPETISRLIQYNIPLEVCLSSNIDTGIYPSLAEHPIKRLLNLGVNVTINTDDRTVSDINLEHEYQLLREVHGLTDADFLRCNLNAARAAFADNETKHWIISQLVADSCYNENVQTI